MASWRACKNWVPFVAAVALAFGCFLLGDANAGAKQSASAGVNLYQDVMSHQANINWQSSPDDNYPDDACDQIDACSADGSKPRVFAIPVATIDGRRVARGVYLVKVKDPKQPLAVVFEHQTVSQTYFFRIAPDGSIMRTAYLEKGKAWLAIANQLGQQTYNKDQADWHAALTKAAGGGKSGQ